MSNNTTSGSAIRLRVDLEDAEVPVWRVIEVDADITLADLHLVIQLAMGWLDYHLHAFSEGDPHQHGPASGRRWETKDLSSDPDEDASDEAETLVNEVLSEHRRRLFYEYDFGDSWIHRIEWIGQAPREPAEDPAQEPAQEPGETALARVLDGGGRCPLEDSGGVDGWADLARCIAGPDSPERDDMMAWASTAIGSDGQLDVTSFDIAAANRAMHTLSVLVGRFQSITASRVKATVLDELLMRLPMFAAIHCAQRANLPADFLANPAAPAWRRVTPELAAATLRPLSWLLEQIGPRGLMLTQAGWLPPKLVAESINVLGIDSRFMIGRPTESKIVALARLRALAEKLGLIRKSRGRLSITKDAAAAIADPVAFEELLAQRLGTRKFGPAEHDAVVIVAMFAAFLGERPVHEFWNDVATVLTALGWNAGMFGVSAGDASRVAMPARTVFEYTRALKVDDAAFVAQPGLHELARSVLAAPVPATRPNW
ncbi:MAG: plasmid pRiA4b ORF-3 family protein [Bifidobacteriaceae bacterium]|nr:plasmid pRiA4b ORF-3 family protein [Bifidobacteriaceae bacterium]